MRCRRLKPDRIAGVGGLTTRHDSMAAGEAGADYVLFGEPDAKGQRPSVEAIAERLQWWAELFEPPCVGFAASREEAYEFAAAGADFVLVGDFIWADPRGAGGGADGGRTGDPAGAQGSRKSQSRAGIAPEMKIPRSISIFTSILALWCLAGAAVAQVSLAPPGARRHRRKRPGRPPSRSRKPNAKRRSRSRPQPPKPGRRRRPPRP